MSGKKLIWIEVMPIVMWEKEKLKNVKRKKKKR